MKLLQRISKRLLAALLVAAFAVVPLAGAAAGGTTIAGRVLDVQGGLPVSGATATLRRGSKEIATAKTDASGVFEFRDEPPGTYAVTIRADGYETTISQDLAIAAGEARTDTQIAINRQTQGIRQIAQVVVAKNNALQVSTTINTHVDTSQLTDQNFQRLGDVLTTVPGVVTATSSSVGDDMTLSVRGFNATETATLLDGHPIGPIGAFGLGYNYNVSPFWGLSGADVIFGSGATGVYGATTIAGAVDLQTINPTRENQISFTQGAGSYAKYMTGLLATGTVKNLGYAFAWGVQGTNGNFEPGYRLQTALLQGSAVPAHQPIGNFAQPADLTTANATNQANYYNVSGQYSQYNFVGKLTYDFGPKTSLLLSSYAADDWSNSTGEGDNDYQTFPYVLYNAQQQIASLPHGVDRTKLNNGKTYVCKNSLVVLNNTPFGYACMNAVQYANNLFGPFGGGPGRWRTLGNQDYHARLDQGIGMSTLSVDYYQDQYNYNEQKGPGWQGGPYYLYLYNTRGYQVNDEFAWAKNDLDFGYDYLRQFNSNGTYPFNTPSGNQYNEFVVGPQLALSDISYFVKDVWTPSLKFSGFANLWVQRSVNTASTNFDPRITAVYRPDSADVVRLTGGKAISEPAPGLIQESPVVNYGAPSSLNPVCGAGNLNPIASVNDPNLVPEKASDLELAYGHRFTPQTTLQGDVYQTWESQALLAGNVPISSVHQYTVPQHLVDQYLARIAQVCGGKPTVADLGFSTTYNAAGARYRGINLTGTLGITRALAMNANYVIQSASYLGIAQDILQENPTLLDGGQIAGVPLRQGTVGLALSERSGFAANLTENYVGGNNTFHRGAFWFANGSLSQTTGSVTVNLGVYNIFNNAAQQYGYIGYGTFQPENQYGTDTNAFQQSSEQYGLPFRSVWLTVKFGLPMKNPNAATPGSL